LDALSYDLISFVDTSFVLRRQNLGTLSERIVILLHVVGLCLFLWWQHRCCRALREVCSDYL